MMAVGTSIVLTMFAVGIVSNDNSTTHMTGQPRGPIAHWTLDTIRIRQATDGQPGNSRIVDVVARRYDGRLAGQPTAAIQQGLIGAGSLEFSASGQNVSGSSGGLPSGTEPGTISLWFRVDAGVSDKVLFSYGGSGRGQARGLWLYNTRQLCFYFMGHPADLHVAIPQGIHPNRWHHVAATYDGATARIYYDGDLLGQVDVELETPQDGMFYLGKNLVADHRDLLGELDDVAIYDRALSAGEIRAIFEPQLERIERLEAERAAEIRKAMARVVEQSGVEDIVFAVRQPGKDGHWYANFGYWVTDPERKLYSDGGRLCRLHVPTGKLQVLLDAPGGGIRDPHVSYDGRRILFSYRRQGEEHYHLCEMDHDGTNLRQLTDGPFDDFEPCYLPTGDIVFCSSRCRRWVPCWSTQVAVLYRCDGDGRNIRPLSSNVEQENTPAVLPDGRLLYTRWEYLDRSQVDYHHLWTINPDGTGQMIYYGNQHPGTVMIDARPIPGGNRVIASFSPGHGRTEHAGTITVVDPALGPDDRPSARAISPGNDFRDPWPLSANHFLVARGGEVLLMDERGRVTPVYRLSTSDLQHGMQVHEPRPLRSRRREQLVPSRVDPRQASGRLVLANVYQGRNMAGVKPGDIKRLLVLESLPEPANFNGAYPYKISWMEPITFGGSFTLTRVLGTVPVEADGSAHFELPAMRSLFFVALDERGLAVKRMQSFVTVQPGETTSCVGCHEQRTRAAESRALPSQALVAAERAPNQIEPIGYEIPDVLDFPRDIQPILDKHCVRCHEPDKLEGGVDLTGDHSPNYSQSYLAMIKHRLIVDGRNRAGNRPPRTIGSSASRLIRLIDEHHEGIRLSDAERTMLILWIETGAAYAGTYAAYHSGMVHVNFPVETMTRRCGACHGVRPGSHHVLDWEGYDTRPWTSLPLAFGDEGPASTLCNLTRPQKSRLLLAPLGREAGGYGLCHVASGENTENFVFGDVHDVDYRRILGAIEKAREELVAIKRFDMPGYRPNEHYVREMLRFGILPPETPAEGAIDPYATDRAYWRSMWYRPVANP